MKFHRQLRLWKGNWKPLKPFEQIYIKEKFAVIGEYRRRTADVSLKFLLIFFIRKSTIPKALCAVSKVVANEPLVADFVGYESFPAPTCSIVPFMLHLTTIVPKPADYSNQLTSKHFYPTSSTYFVLPQTAQYDPASVSLAHSTTLVFLQKILEVFFYLILKLADVVCFQQKIVVITWYWCGFSAVSPTKGIS